MDDVFIGLVPTVDVTIIVTSDDVVTDIVYVEDAVKRLEMVCITVRADVTVPKADFEADVDEVSDACAEEDDKTERLAVNVDFNETVF